MDYEAVIGLETHVQLKTRSKMWCGCANEFGAPPNTHVCPVCLGLPGVLPVANEEALRLTALTGYLPETWWQAQDSRAQGYNGGANQGSSAPAK